MCTNTSCHVSGEDRRGVHVTDGGAGRGATRRGRGRRRGRPPAALRPARALRAARARARHPRAARYPPTYTPTYLHTIIRSLLSFFFSVLPFLQIKSIYLHPCYKSSIQVSETANSLPTLKHVSSNIVTIISSKRVL